MSPLKPKPYEVSVEWTDVRKSGLPPPSTICDYRVISKFDDGTAWSVRLWRENGELPFEVLQFLCYEGPVEAGQVFKLYEHPGLPPVAYVTVLSEVG